MCLNNEMSTKKNMACMLPIHIHIYYAIHDYIQNTLSAILSSNNQFIKKNIFNGKLEKRFYCAEPDGLQFFWGTFSFLN